MSKNFDLTSTATFRKSLTEIEKERFATTEKNRDIAFHVIDIIEKFYNIDIEWDEPDIITFAGTERDMPLFINGILKLPGDICHLEVSVLFDLEKYEEQIGVIVELQYLDDERICQVNIPINCEHMTGEIMSVSAVDVERGWDAEPDEGDIPECKHQEEQLILVCDTITQYLFKCHMVYTHEHNDI